MVRFLLRDEATPRSELTASDLNACHVAVDEGHTQLTFHLLQKIPTADDALGNSTYWHQLHSKYALIAVEARYSSVVAALKRVVVSISSNSINVTADQFEQLLSETDIESSDYAELVLLEADLLREHRK